MWKVTGDAGVEVLPVVPVVYEGVDEVGRKQMAGLCDWIGWLSRKSGRESISHLAETGGEDREKDICGRLIYTPKGLVQRQKSVGGGGWRGGGVAQLGEWSL